MNKIQVFVVLCLVSTLAFAGGYRVSTQSNKQLAMGHTGVAVVNSADILFFNPAGLVHLESRLSVSVGGFGVISDVSYQNEQTGAFAETDSPVGTPLYLYASYKVSDDFAVGLGVYTPYGSNVTWPTDWEGSHLVNEIELSAIFVQPTLSYQLFDSVSLGGGAIIAIGDLLKVSADIECFGGQGITIHPRPDERHIRYQDARDLKRVVQTEFNIEGNPIESFINLVNEVRPHQVTLVPDAVDAITSNAGWDTIKHRDFLSKTVAHFKSLGIRTSIFVDPVIAMVEGAAATGVDRIELYTEDYATGYKDDPSQAIAPYIKAAEKANELGIGINAGHDLSLDNIKYFNDHIPGLKEVSIGHALIAESLYLGLENVINMYKHRLS